MELTGTVLNVVDFGAFVDIGMHDSGLVHVSQLADKFVRDPHDVVAVGDIVRVWVIEVDKERRRVSLTMMRPGTERAKTPHRGGRPEHKPAAGGRAPEHKAATAGRASEQKAATGGRARGKAAPGGRPPTTSIRPRRPPAARPRPAQEGISIAPPIAPGRPRSR